MEFRKDVSEKFDGVHKRLDKIEIQTTKINGKVGSLERSRIQIWTAISVTVVLVGTIFALYSQTIDAKIKEGIAQALTEKYNITNE